MNARHKSISRFLGIALLTLPLVVLGQDEDSSSPGEVDDPFALDGVEAASDEQPKIDNEFTIGLYYLDDDSYRYGKYTGLTDEGFYLLGDFRIEKRPEWDGDDTRRWRVQGWRLGLESRRIQFDYTQQGTQSFSAEYREIPNYRFDDGLIPYRDSGSDTVGLASGWEVAEGSSNTRGFLTLDESLTSLKMDTKRRRLKMTYDRNLGKQWNLKVDYSHETKKGGRTIGSIFGYTGGNPRAVLLAAPVDYKTDNIEAMFGFANFRTQFGFGFYGSFFNNDKTSLTWQNAYGHQSQWADGVNFPGSQGRLALEPDNSFVQFKAHAGFNFASSTRLTANVAFGKMKQNDHLLPYTVNPDLIVHTPVPLDKLDAKINTTMINLRLTSQLARRLGLALNYNYDDRDNKTPRASYPYIGGDSQNQRPDEDGRINLPYSYRRSKFDAIGTYRAGHGIRIKGGYEYSDYSRDYSEVSDSNENTWLLGVKFAGMEKAAVSLDYRNSSRDVSEYIGNVPLIASHLPGQVSPDEWENHPMIRKYYLTDRDRDEFRFRADIFPTTEFNFGLAGSYFKDDYDEGFFGLNDAKNHSTTVDLGWYPVKNIALIAYYTKEKYQASQSSRSFRNTAGAADPANNWFADTTDKVNTYNISLAFSDIGAERGWNGFNLGFDYTYSDTNSEIQVEAVSATTAPLPDLVSKLKSFSAWASLDIGSSSSIRLAVESSELKTDDWGLDNVVPDTLANVLTLGQSAANYDLVLITGSWTYRF